jgi:hypothetical protein
VHVTVPLLHLQVEMGDDWLGIGTLTVPVVAPVGTVVVISELLAMNAAAVPLKLTLVARVRLFPRIPATRPESVAENVVGEQSTIAELQRPCPLQSPAPQQASTGFAIPH